MFRNWLQNGSVAVVTLALSSVHGFASKPAEDPLLRLVPANAEIVAGIEDPHHGDESGRLLLVTHNDNTDLKDWIALASGDDRQQVDKLIEVAASSPRGELSEHLLLARGSFEGRRILQSVKDNGGADNRYDGVRVVELKPFARERNEMTDTRWLAVPDDNTVIFGSPVLVKSALDRYVSSAPVDGDLASRMSELKPDVNCWSILVMPGRMIAAHVLPGILDETGNALVQRVTSVSLSVRYGSKERVDFAFDTENPEVANALRSAITGPAHLLPAADVLHSHLESMSVQGNEVRGSVRVAGKKFDPWLAGLYSPVQAGGRGESIAQVAAGR